uniref:SET domain-containing protein n=1 Tax=Panagrolaimus sp. ES5 TaxID=591445 RepID=A0AC34FWL2_9BILA
MSTKKLDKDVQEKLDQANQSEHLNQMPPMPRQNRNADKQRKIWDMRVLQSKSQGSHTNFSAGTSFATNESHYCKTSFGDLKPIILRDMKAPMIHRGRYLVCKCICKPLPLVGIFESPNDGTYIAGGINMLIQDLNGDVEEVSIYNFLYQFANLDWMSSETVMIIKEPWLRYGSQSKVPSIRVDSPSDTMFVDVTDGEFMNKIGAKKWIVKKSKDANVWREEANDCFKSGNFEKALFLYDRAIRCNPELSVLYLNKSLTCLRSGAFYTAYKAAELGFDKSGERDKALLRMGQAAYGMREWQKAAKIFVSVLKEFPSNVSFSENLKRATTRLAEQKHGKYNFKAMHLESKKEKAQLDVADYSEPIEIANIPGKGRGIIASKNIKEGTLIAVSKAFSSGYSKDFDVDHFNMLLNPGGAAHMNHEHDTLKKLQNNPQSLKDIYDLYPGDLATRNEKIPFGILDAALIQKICAINRYGSGEKKDRDEMVDCHLHILPSYFNHACLANAYRTRYGDVMVVHAAADTKKGEEIYLSYLESTRSYLDRKKKLSEWKFVCRCKLCENDAKDPKCSKRYQIWKEFEEYANEASPEDIIAKGEPVLQKIRESYVDRNELQIILAQILISLSSAYYRLDNFSKCIKYLEEVVTLTDNPLKYDLNVADQYICLALCYASKKNAQKSLQMFDKSMELKFCKNMEEFKLHYPDIFNHKCAHSCAHHSH